MWANTQRQIYLHRNRVSYLQLFIPFNTHSISSSDPTAPPLRFIGDADYKINGECKIYYDYLTNASFWHLITQKSLFYQTPTLKSIANVNKVNFTSAILA